MSAWRRPSPSLTRRLTDLRRRSVTKVVDCTAEASIRAAKCRSRPRSTKSYFNRPLTDHFEARLVTLDYPITIAIELD